MVRPGREPLSGPIEADESCLGGRRPGRTGRGAHGKTVVAGAVETSPGPRKKRRLGRLRLAAVADASAKSLEGFLDANTLKPLGTTTDGWRGYAGLKAKGYSHKPLTIDRSQGDAAPHLPAIHLVFGLAKR